MLYWRAPSLSLLPKSDVSDFGQSIKRPNSGKPEFGCKRGRGHTERAAPPSRRLAQHDTHGVEQVHRHAHPAGGGDALAGEPEHPPQLKGDERGRNDFPGMVEMLERKPEAGGQAAHARPRKEPQVLWRRD